MRVHGYYCADKLLRGYESENSQAIRGNQAVTWCNGAQSASVGWRHVLRRGRGALAEEELFHLFHDHFLILLARRIQAIFVQKHLAVLRPLAPGLLRNLIVDFLAELRIER